MRLLRVWSAVGCADVTGGVAGGWLRRDGDMTTVGCNETDETWYLACRDGRWVGNITGCGTTGAGHTATGRSQSLVIYLHQLRQLLRQNRRRRTLARLRKPEIECQSSDYGQIFGE